MYNMIICDDEEIILKGLSQSVSWERFNLHVSACFEDGREALAYLERHPIDVVLTDINMADVSGLELAKQVQACYPDTKVVILSGYRDFTFARQAMQYNVQHYLLKPIDFDEMDRVFTEIQQGLDARRSEAATLKKQQDKMTELLPALREQFFSDVLMGNLRSREEAVRRLELLELPIDLSDYHFYSIRLRMKEDTVRRQADASRLLERVRRFVQENLRMPLRDPLYAVVTQDSTMHMLVFTPEEEGNFRAVLEEGLRQLTASVSKVFGVDLSWEIESRFRNILEAASFRLRIHRESEHVELGGRLGDQLEKYGQLVRSYKPLAAAIYEGQRELLLEQVDELFSALEALPLPGVRRLLIDMFALLANHMADWGIHLLALTNGRLDYARIMQLQQMEEIKRWTLDMLLSILEEAGNQRMPANDKLFEKVKHYIGTRFTEDLTLDEVANHVFLNPVYFSRLFKKEVGINFIDYVTRLRIDQAKSLLQGGQYKAYEVSEMVGYRSSKYFTKVFKQMTGYTPKSYSRMVNERE